mmetsp:Transcript_19997/g.39621  ORF Transcript_19997/g.39621 Transcript_19997/m.39621 type:complete len:416 (-) Transcript_19997:67-1314(-)
MHNHEASSGRTSSVSHHIMGFDENKKAVHQTVAASANAAAKSKSWGHIVEKSRQVLTFIDLAGHEKYLKTTIGGLTGCFPDFAMVLINSLAGITKMTKEHLGVVIALKIPLFVVVTKVDMAPANVLEQTKKTLTRALRSPSAGKRLPVTVREEKDVSTVLNNPSPTVVPIFYLSCVTGENLPLLELYLAGLQPNKTWEEKEASEDQAEFHIDQTFSVPGVGVVLSGTMCEGKMTAHQDLLLGPFSDGSFKSVFVRSVHCKRTAVETAEAGVNCAVSIRSNNRKDLLKRENIRPGMVMVHPNVKPQAAVAFIAEVLVLHHPSTIKIRYQAVIHCGIIRQTAAITEINQECLRTGDKALVTFRFMVRPEYLKTGLTFVFREGNTKGIGKIVQLLHEYKNPLERKSRYRGKELSPAAQ